MSGVNLIYKLDGDKVEAINVLELAPILLSIGRLVQESRSLLLPDSNEIAVSVKPFREGSFIVDFSIIFKTNYDQFVELVNGHSATEITNLLKQLGLLSGSSISLLRLYKFLKAKPKKILPNQEGTFTYYDSQNNSMTVDVKTHILYQSKTVQESMFNAFGRPLQTEGINSISSYDSDQPTESEVTVTKSEADFFEPVDASKLLDENETENIAEVYLKPKRGSFEGDAQHWSFRKSDNANEIITATIRDQQFLEKITSGEIRLFHEDILKVKLLTKQKIRGSELSTVYEITEVMEYHEAGKQPPLL
jgi:hypothetical protein